jgi:nicotinate-nucleotide--dimethylbenzimidazole phosphoribosyltransferase
VSDDLDRLVRRAIDNKTKPRGSLGALEELAAQICRVQGTVAPSLAKPTVVVFAADHGLAREPVSAYPREVTEQMALNIVAGGAGVNVFCRQHGIAVVLVDAGVDWSGGRPAGMVDHWIGPGTASSLTGDAMTADELERCLAAGAAVVDHVVDPGCAVVGFGELGIGNTSAASLLVSALAGLPLADCVGPGTGLAGEGLERKLRLLRQAQDAHPRPADAAEALRMFGGFEIAQMAGAMRRAYESGRLLLVDGFVATAAFLATWSEDASIMDAAVFCHESGEPGHARVLSFLGAKPLVSLGMRLGEGTGCAVAYPIIASAVAFLNEMASFADAGVSTGEPEAGPT